jgi:predicted GIY-YIG superfamily endonuclease
MLQCRDGSYYVGQTDDLQKRLAEHESGILPGYTQSRRPVTLAWSQEFPTREEARQAELQVKRWNRAKKEALIAGRFDLISKLASRSREGRALRDALLRKAPQGRG